ncbi:MAG TPA: hypothetical protein VK888_00285 [Anaerolineales bacterium]|nr:hypothetical protein [Anaerolineales bacterium]
MKHGNPFPQPVQEPGWQLLGEQVLPLGADLQDEISEWLIRLLRPHSLHEDFLNKLIDSAKEAVRRAALADTVEQTGHLHVLVYIRNGESAVQTWGFFRIEKIEEPNDGQDVPGHAIDFYLYPEGH